MALFDVLKAASDRAKAEDSTEDRERFIGEWNAALHGLYEDIISWLRPFIDQELVRVRRPSIQTKEDPLGTYDTSALEIMVGKQVIVVQPVGRFVVGGTGRVDIYARGRSSEDERVRILRNGEGEDARWLIVKKPFIKIPGYTSDVRYVFDRGQFEQCLEALVR